MCNPASQLENPSATQTSKAKPKPNHPLSQPTPPRPEPWPMLLKTTSAAGTNPRLQIPRPHPLILQYTPQLHSFPWIDWTLKLAQTWTPCIMLNFLLTRENAGIPRKAKVVWQLSNPMDPNTCCNYPEAPIPLVWGLQTTWF